MRIGLPDLAPVRVGCGTAPLSKRFHQAPISASGAFVLISQNCIDTSPRIHVERAFHCSNQWKSKCSVDALFGISAKASLSPNSIQ